MIGYTLLLIFLMNITYRFVRNKFCHANINQSTKMIHKEIYTER